MCETEPVQRELVPRCTACPQWFAGLTSRERESMENQVKSGDAPVLVAAICGSLRQQSYTRMAVRLALRGAAERGAQTRLIDLRDYSLVFCDGRDGVYPESVGQ